MASGTESGRVDGESSSVSTNTLSYEHIFNDDLLMSQADLAYAKSQFPEIIHVLDYPRLREKFAAYEKEANRAGDRVRCLGFTAVVSAMLALIAIATKPVWPGASWTRWVALVIELVGMCAALIAAGGLWLGPWKRRWLESRLMTERLRQWHFQLMLRRGREVDSSGEGQNAISAFKQERDRWFEDFLTTCEGKLDTQLELLTNEPGDTGVWLHAPPTNYDDKSTLVSNVLAAYEIGRAHV